MVRFHLTLEALTSSLFRCPPLKQTKTDPNLSAEEKHRRRLQHLEAHQLEQWQDRCSQWIAEDSAKLEAFLVQLRLRQQKLIEIDQKRLANYREQLETQRDAIDGAIEMRRKRFDAQQTQQVHSASNQANRTIASSSHALNQLHAYRHVLMATRVSAPSTVVDLSSKSIAAPKHISIAPLQRSIIDEHKDLASHLYTHLLRDGHPQNRGLTLMKQDGVASTDVVTLNIPTLNQLQGLLRLENSLRAQMGVDEEWNRPAELPPALHHPIQHKIEPSLAATGELASTPIPDTSSSAAAPPKAMQNRRGENYLKQLDIAERFLDQPPSRSRRPVIDNVYKKFEPVQRVCHTFHRAFHLPLTLTHFPGTHCTCRRTRVR